MKKIQKSACTNHTWFVVIIDNLLILEEEFFWNYFIVILQVLVHTKTHTHMLDRCYLQTAILLKIKKNKYIENKKEIVIEGKKKRSNKITYQRYLIV